MKKTHLVSFFFISFDTSVTFQVWAIDIVSTITTASRFSINDLWCPIIIRQHHHRHYFFWYWNDDQNYLMLMYRTFQQPKYFFSFQIFLVWCESLFVCVHVLQHPFLIIGIFYLIGQINRLFGTCFFSPKSGGEWWWWWW